MELEKYKRAIEISDRLKELEEATKEIAQSSKRKLSYVDMDNRGCTEWRMNYISEILDNHDKMIREDIQQEIGRLLAEINSL